MSNPVTTQIVLAPGDTAPDFDLPATGGKRIRLSSLRGQPVVLYFYPQDGSETCTAESLAFSSHKPRFTRAGAALFGISPDSLSRHEAFKAKHRLFVDLISDENRQAIEAYGLWIEKTLFGHVHMGVDRSTFLIGADGRIVALWRKVRLKNHVEDLLSRLNSISG